VDDEPLLSGPEAAMASRGIDVNAAHSR